MEGNKDKFQKQNFHITRGFFLFLTNCFLEKQYEFKFKFFFKYIKNPFYIGFSRKIDVYELLLLGGAYILCVFFIGGIIKVYCIITHIQPTAGHLDIANDTFLSSLLIVVLAPIKEEIQFRLLLRPKKPNLLLFNVVMLSTSLIFVYFEKWQQAVVYLIVTVLLSVFFIFFLK